MELSPQHGYSRFIGAKCNLLTVKKSSTFLPTAVTEKVAGIFGFSEHRKIFGGRELNFFLELSMELSEKKFSSFF